MISGRSRLTTYAHGDIVKPGNGSSSVQAPPTRSRCSSTSTFLPARAKYPAATRPLWPAPIMIASNCSVRSVIGGVSFQERQGEHSCLHREYNIRVAEFRKKGLGLPQTALCLSL